MLHKELSLLPSLGSNSPFPLSKVFIPTGLKLSVSSSS